METKKFKIMKGDVELVSYETKEEARKALGRLLYDLNDLEIVEEIISNEKLKEYNIFTKPTKVKYCFRVNAFNIEEAKNKLKKLGYNCGERLSTSSYEDFEVEEVLEIKGGALN